MFNTVVLLLSLIIFPLCAIPVSHRYQPQEAVEILQNIQCPVCDYSVLWIAKNLLQWKRRCALNPRSDPEICELSVAGFKTRSMPSTIHGGEDPLGDPSEYSHRDRGDTWSVSKVLIREVLVKKLCKEGSLEEFPAMEQTMTGSESVPATPPTRMDPLPDHFKELIQESCEESLVKPDNVHLRDHIIQTIISFLHDQNDLSPGTFELAEEHQLWDLTQELRNLSTRRFEVEEVADMGNPAESAVTLQTLKARQVEVRNLIDEARRIRRERDYLALVELQKKLCWKACGAIRRPPTMIDREKRRSLGWNVHGAFIHRTAPFVWQDAWERIAFETAAKKRREAVKARAFEPKSLSSKETDAMHSIVNPIRDEL